MHLASNSPGIEAWILPLTTWVTLYKLYNLFEPQFPYLQVDKNNDLSHKGLLSIE